MAKRKRTNNDLQNTTLKIEQHKPTKIQGGKSGATDLFAVPAPLVLPYKLADIMLFKFLLKDGNRY